MKIKKRKMQVFTDDFNYSCEVGGVKVHIYRGQSEISVEDIQLSKSVNTFEDLEQVAKLYEMQRKMVYKVNKLVEEGQSQDQAISDVVSEYNLSTNQETKTINYLLENTDYNYKY